MSDFSYNSNKIELKPILERFNQVLIIAKCKESYLSKQVFGNGNRYRQIKSGESELTPRVHNRAWKRLEEIMNKHQAKQANQREIKEND